MSENKIIKIYCRKVSLIVKKCSEFSLIEAKFDRVVFKFYSVNSQLVIPPTTEIV